MSKIRVNYKSDLPPVAVKFKINGSVVDVPDHDFVIRFFVDGAPGTSFECVHKGEEYINCAKTVVDTLTCYINNHKFGCGRLCCEFIDLSADSRYEDNVLKTVTPSCLDVVLVEGAGDENIEVLNAVFGYEINEIASITAEESDEDGGTNVVTITETNGQEFSFGVKNGHTGNGIASIETTQSAVSGGTNIVTITETNGTETEFAVLNGLNGVVLEGDPATYIADNLTTDDPLQVLSARQGFVLKGLIDNIDGETVVRTATADLEEYSGGQTVQINIDLRAGVKYKITLSTDVSNTKYYIRAARVDSTLDYLKNDTTANLTTPVTVEVTPDYDYKDFRVNLTGVAAEGTLTVSVEGVLRIEEAEKYVPLGLGKNIYNPSEKRNGLRVDESGITSLYASDYSITGYIPIANGQTLVCDSVLNNYNTCALFARIGDLAPIPGTYAAPDKALGYKAITNSLGYDAFAVFTIHKSNDVQVEVGSTPTDFEPYNPISRYVDNSEQERLNEKINLVCGGTAVVKSVNHRGYNTIAPENTMPAFVLSVRKGFPYIETDIHFTSDGVAVLLHDDTINRTARNSDGTSIESTINIGDITYEQALGYDFGIWKGAQFEGTEIPTLAQFLGFCRAAGVHPYLELKCANDEVADVVSVVEANGMKGHVTYIGAQAKLELVHTADANARLGLVIGTVTASSITNLLTLKTTTNEVFVDTGDTSAGAVTMCKTAKVPMERYTINTSAGITALDPYITGVTSDSLVASTVLYDALWE